MKEKKAGRLGVGKMEKEEVWGRENKGTFHTSSQSLPHNRFWRPFQVLTLSPSLYIHREYI